MGAPLGPRAIRRSILLVLTAVAAVLGVLAPTGSGAAEPVTTHITATATCRGDTQPDQDVLNQLTLTSLLVDLSYTAPVQVRLGEAAETTLSLSYSVTGSMAAGAATLGLHSVDLTGTSFTVSMLGTAGGQSTTVSPPDPRFDPRQPSDIQLGTATFAVPTAAVGAVVLEPDSAKVVVRAEPGGLVVRATCGIDISPWSLFDLPITFVTDPAGPVLDPPAARLGSPTDSGTADLRSSVGVPAGTVPGDWRVVRVLGKGTADLDDGRLSWTLSGGSQLVVWEVCAVPAPSTTTTGPAPTSTASTTTTSVPSSTVDATPDTGSAVMTVADEPTTTAGAGPSDTSDTTTSAPATVDHCAQGVAVIVSTATGETAVLSESTELDETGSAGVGAAPLAFTG